MTTNGLLAPWLGSCPALFVWVGPKPGQPCGEPTCSPDRRPATFISVHWEALPPLCLLWVCPRPWPVGEAMPSLLIIPLAYNLRSSLPTGSLVTSSRTWRSPGTKTLMAGQITLDISHAATTLLVISVVQIVRSFMSGVVLDGRRCRISISCNIMNPTHTHTKAAQGRAEPGS